MTRLLAASTLDVAEFEAKLVLAEAVHALAEVAASCEERAAELGAAPKPDQRRATDEQEERLAVALATPPHQRLAALPRAWLTPLLGMFGTSPFDPLLDGPSERVRRRGLSDLQDALGGLLDAAARLRPAADQPAVPSSRPAVRTAQRPTMGRRDERFATFENTRDYRGAADWRDLGSPYDNDLLELVRVNRDEIDALETFALALFDLVAEADLESLRHLARLTWDEARHAAIGQELLHERFGDPFAYECSMIGIRVRGQMTGWHAWTQITVFGELGIIGPMRALERTARRRGDDRIAHAFGFIASDETMHLRDSRRLLDRNHPAGGLARAADAARARAGRILEELGLYDAEQFAQLDERQIFELLGE
ncbi:hypothetical protein OHS33_35890 [Streptomyces sp. NBC_00536]|uniref:hypothetical protein n=1 Tax=Streptomyces sp. NBC_00536 TaxID=2975769 RepID=UPI002E81454F|nr:hypothetical protein [Streptomyces sp. NBC_00536]WUC83289.1 hypothetical protein OHS33_35890 [Streptomyces sp. NBC_00536]